MITHQPDNYTCPFCDWLAGNETAYKQNSDIVYQDANTVAFIAPKWWINNPGHVLVIPNGHYENIYSIPDEALSAVYRTAKKMAVGLKAAYECDGTSMRQHNEPAGNQDVWHFHVHVYPRYSDDKLYQLHDEKRFVSPEERLKYAERMRAVLTS